MSYKRKTLAETREQVAADIDRHSDGNANIRGSLEFALTNALSAGLHSLGGHIDWVHNQRFIDSADEENVLREAAEYDIQRLPAHYATGKVLVNGFVGTTVPLNRQIYIGEQFYKTTQKVVLSAQWAYVNVTALEAGAAGNQPVGATLEFVEPIENLDIDCESYGITGGSDIESIDRVRDRLAERKRTPPMGGSSDDYVAWAKAGHNDITRVWVIPHKNPSYQDEYGSILIYPVTDNLETPIPSSSILQAVETYIIRPQIRPIGAQVIYIEALTPINLDITFTALDPNTESIQDAVVAELRDLLAEESEPGGTLLLSHIREAVSRAVGENDFAFNLNVDITVNAGELLVLGAITWPAA